MISQKIVVIGAGISGFSAAAKLMENGFNDIVILEAENRTGGRIHSIPHGNGFIDLGAQWCHGQGRNVIYELVSKHFAFGDTGLEDNDSVFYQSTGKLAKQAQCVKLATLSESILDEYTQMEKFNGSLGDFFVIKYRESLKSSNYNTIPIELTNQMLDYTHKNVVYDFASPTWFDISAKLNALSVGTTGKQLLTWKTFGFKTAFDYITVSFFLKVLQNSNNCWFNLQKKLPPGSHFLNVEAKIHLNKEVTNIKYNQSSSQDKVYVSCSDGSIYAADHVIFTASLGVLKARHETLFTPKLPAAKVKAIENLGFGTLGKVFLEFDKPFWPTNNSVFVAYSLLWTDETLKNIKTTDRAWLIDINSFIIVDGFPNILETLISGRKMAEFEALSDTKIIDDCTWLLESFLNRTIPRPKIMTRTRWLTNNNFLGSYSYHSMATEISKVSPSDLAKSILSSTNKPTILFAGEATDLKFSSYANGAVESGWRAGNELAAYLRK